MNIESELQIFRERAKNVANNDKRLAAVMMDMEIKYQFHCHGNQSGFMDFGNAGDEQILAVYRYVAGLRSF